MKMMMDAEIESGRAPVPIRRMKGTPPGEPPDMPQKSDRVQREIEDLLNKLDKDAP